LPCSTGFTFSIYSYLAAGLWVSTMPGKKREGREGRKRPDRFADFFPINFGAVRFVREGKEERKGEAVQSCSAIPYAAGCRADADGLKKKGERKKRREERQPASRVIPAAIRDCLNMLLSKKKKKKKEEKKEGKEGGRGEKTAANRLSSPFRTAPHTAIRESVREEGKKKKEKKGRRREILRSTITVCSHCFLGF